MQTNGYVILNGRTPGDRPTRLTYCSKTGSSVIDLVVVNASSLSEIKNFRIKAEAGLSDHFPAELTWSVDDGGPISSVDMEETSGSPVPKHNWAPDAASQYKCDISSKLRLAGTPVLQSGEVACEKLIKVMLK